MYFMDESEALDPTGSQLPELIPGFCSMMQLGVFTPAVAGRDTSPSQVIPSQFVRFPQQFAGTHLYSWVGETHCES